MHGEHTSATLNRQFWATIYVPKLYWRPDERKYFDECSKKKKKRKKKSLRPINRRACANSIQT